MNAITVIFYAAIIAAVGALLAPVIPTIYQALHNRREVKKQYVEQIKVIYDLVLEVKKWVDCETEYYLSLYRGESPTENTIVYPVEKIVALARMYEESLLDLAMRFDQDIMDIEFIRNDIFYEKMKKPKKDDEFYEKVNQLSQKFYRDFSEFERKVDQLIK